MKITGIIITLILPWWAFTQNVKVDIQPEGVLFTEGKDQVLYYNTKGNASHGAYQRPHYVHPLYSLEGQVLTEDFPEDHPHHHGIFWAWHQLYIGDKRIGDGWENKDFNWSVLSVREGAINGPEKQIVTEVNWTSPLWLDENGSEKPFVSEITKITVYPAIKKYRLIDFEISLKALESDVRIGGSEDSKGYGGFSPRINMPNDIRFTDINGVVVPQTNPVEGSGWLDILGSLGAEGGFSGLSILSHTENPGYPNPWILRSKRSMQNAVYPYPGATPVSLSKNPTVLRYRLVVHNGLKSNEIDRLHRQYCQ